MEEIVRENVPARTGGHHGIRVVRFGRIIACIEVKAVFAAIAHFVLLDQIVRSTYAKAHSCVEIRDDQIVADGCAVGVEDRDAAVAILKRLVVLDQSVVAVAMEHDAVAAVGPGAIVANDDVVAAPRGNYPVMPAADQSVVMDIVAFDEQVVGVVVRIKAIPGVVIHFVVAPLAAKGAKGVSAPKIVMDVAVEDVAEN